MPAIERRFTPRFTIQTPIRFRDLTARSAAESRAESGNLSRRGVYFTTGLPVKVGTMLQVLLKMPSEITGEPTTEWRCTGRVIHVQSNGIPHGKVGVGVRFDFYDVLSARRAR